MILARILAPDQLGMMALIMGFTVAFEALTEVGVKQSIIQNKQGARADYLNVAWWFQVIRALGLFGIAILMAPWISSFYENPELLSLLRVAFLAIALRGFVSPRAHVLEKEYKFGWAILLDQGSAVLGAVLTVSLAFVMRNVWALVVGFVAETALLCILSFVLVPFVPRFSVDRQSFGELMKFARGMFGLPLLGAISFQAPVLILGKVISAHELGLYSLAAIFAYIPTDLYTRIVGPVVLPAFSEKQDNKRALCRGVLQMTRYTAVLIIPLITFMACCASELLAVVYGPQYVSMAIPFAVLCVQVLARSEAVPLAGLYLAVGQPHLQRRFSVIRAVGIVGFTYPAAVRFGPVGVVVVVALTSFSVLLMQVFQGRKVIDLDLGRYMRCYVVGMLSAVPIIVAVGLLRIFGIDSPLPVLSVGFLALVVTSAAGVLLLGDGE
jgi:O-antigen/teichoic acid export membrane protein